MAELPTFTQERRPVPKFGRVNQLSPVVNDPDIVEGAAINRLGEALTTTMIRLQIKEDKYMVEDATTKLKQASLDLAKGESGYLHVKSGDVDDAFHEERMSQFDAARAEISEGLKNNNQMGAFAARAELARVNYGEGLINHITNQKDIFKTQTYEAGVVTEQESAMANWENPSEIYQSLDRIENLTREEASRRGVKGEVADLLVKENLSTAHAGVVQTMVDNRDYSEAREWYGDHKDDIMGETQSKIEKLLDAAGKQDRSQALVDGMWDEYQDDPDAGRKHIRETAAPEDRDESLRRFNTRLAEDDQKQKQEWADLQDEAYGTYISSREAGLTASEAYDSIPPSVRNDMKQTHRMALYNMMQADSRGTAIHTDPDVFMDLFEMAHGTPEEKARFREEVDLRDYPLSVAHRSFFANLQQDVDKVVLASTTADLKKEVATAAGYYDQKSGKRKNATGAYEVNERFDAELARLQESTGHTATPTDERGIADRMKIEIVRKRSLSNWFEDTMLAGTAEIEGVPTEMIDELAFRLVESKREDLKEGEVLEPITVQEIKDYYAWTIRKTSGTPVPISQKTTDQHYPYGSPFDNPMRGAPPGRR